MIGANQVSRLPAHHFPSRLALHAPSSDGMVHHVLAQGPRNLSGTIFHRLTVRRSAAGDPRFAHPRAKYTMFFTSQKGS